MIMGTAAGNIWQGNVRRTDTACEKVGTTWRVRGAWCFGLGLSKYLFRTRRLLRFEEDVSTKWELSTLPSFYVSNFISLFL